VILHTLPPRHFLYALQRTQFLLDMYWRYDGPMFLLFIMAPTMALHVQSLFHPPTLYKVDIWGPVEWTFWASALWFPVLRMMGKRAIRAIDAEVQAVRAAL
jgi:hypothetical protein